MINYRNCGRQQQHAGRARSIRCHNQICSDCEHDKDGTFVNVASLVERYSSDKACVAIFQTSSDLEVELCHYTKFRKSCQLLWRSVRRRFFHRWASTTAMSISQRIAGIASRAAVEWWDLDEFDRRRLHVYQQRINFYFHWFMGTQARWSSIQRARADESDGRSNESHESNESDGGHES